MKPSALALLVLVALGVPSPLPYDSSKDATLKSDNAPWRDDAVLGKIASFKGDGQWTTEAAPVPSGAFTLEARVRPQKLPKTGNILLMGSYESWQWFLYIYPDGKGKLVFDSWSGKKQRTVKTAQLLAYDQWHHLALVVEGSPRRATFWVDGAPLADSLYEVRESMEGEIDAPTRPFTLGNRLRGELAGVTLSPGAKSAADLKAAASKIPAAIPAPSDPEPPPSVAATQPATRASGATLRIHLMGDSTVATYKEAQFPLMGWGQVFGRFFGPAVEVVNYAVGGRSTKSFIDEKRWDAVLAALAPGDWLFIQFGHNDEKKDKPEVYAAPDGAYREFLALFIAKAREKGANPVLVTPVARRSFSSDGRFYNSHGVYPDAMKAVAAETKAPCIDLTEKSGALLQSLGAEGAKKLYNYCEPGQFPGWPKGNRDDSHFCEAGAMEIAKLILTGIRERQLPLADQIK